MNALMNGVAGAAIVAGLFFAAPHQAQAGITCNLTDQRNNTLTYSFNRGGDGYANELRVMRNGSITADGSMAVWTRVPNKANRNTTLWSTTDTGWAITYRWDNTGATLWHNNNSVAVGTCMPDYSIDHADVAANTSPQQRDLNDTPLYNPTPVVTPQSNDVVPIMTANNKAYVMAMVGNQGMEFLIDTGASIGQIPTGLANVLLSNGQATEGGTVSVGMANGAHEDERVVIINTITVGAHVVHNVAMTVTDGMPLLGLNALKLMGKFSIDYANGQLVFG
jgi:gag-polyprotein putative aspartyl protease